MQAAAPSLSVLSHHLYSLGAGSLEPADLVSKILRADFLDKLKAVAATARRAAQSPTSASAHSAASASAAAASGSSASPALWVIEIGAFNPADCF